MFNSYKCYEAIARLQHKRIEIYVCSLEND